MEKISYKDFDFSTMKLLENQGSNSKTYVINGKCYKILNDEFLNKDKLPDKIYALNEIKIDNLVYPDKLIFDGNKFMGYTMDYVTDSENLFDRFSKDRYVDANDILQATKKVSFILEKLHNSGIILCDLSFSNILIDKNDKITICDIDGFRYKDYGSDYVPEFLKTYYDNLGDKLVIDKLSDIQCLLLSMLISLYNRLILNIDDYDTLSDKIKTLSDLRFVVDEFFYYTDAQIPYLHEFIYDDDHYIIDRDTQVSEERRLKKDYRIH